MYFCRATDKTLDHLNRKNRSTIYFNIHVLKFLQFKNVSNFKLLSSNAVAKLHSAESIYGLYNNAVGSSDCVATNGMMVGE
jgi:hypothetical protein